MAFVITQRCCNDASCVPECPVDCIRPAPDHDEFATTEMLYIDPETCIDCGACVEVCPVGAIYSEDDLPEAMQRYKDINADYFQRHPLQPDLSILENPARRPPNWEPCVSRSSARVPRPVTRPRNYWNGPMSRSTCWIACRRRSV